MRYYIDSFSSASRRDQQIVWIAVWKRTTEWKKGKEICILYKMWEASPFATLAKEAYFSAARIHPKKDWYRLILRREVKSFRNLGTSTGPLDRVWAEHFEIECIFDTERVFFLQDMVVWKFDLPPPNCRN